MLIARHVAALAVAVVPVLMHWSPVNASPVEVRTELGTLIGLDASKTTGTYAWLGVPYAKPPVGALRWMPPVAPDAWKAKRTAQKFGASCAQAGRFYSPAPNGAPFGLAVRDGIGKPVGSEDCLTLNIWRPAHSRARLPVIVFIHGGSTVRRSRGRSMRSSSATAAQAWIAKQTDAQIGAYLRGKSAEDLLKVVIANPKLGIAPAVIPDGVIVPTEPLAAITAGNYRQVPILAGNTRDEGKLFGSLVGAYKPNEYDRFTLQFNFKPDEPATLTEADLLNPAFLPIDKQPGGWNAAAAMGSSMFLTQAKRVLDAVSAKQPKQVWYYRFDWDREPKPFDSVYGAAHALDLPFIFGNFGSSIFSFGWSTANAAGRDALSDKMMRSIGTFVRTGDPNDASLSVSWPNWPATLVFDASDEQARISVQ